MTFDDDADLEKRLRRIAAGPEPEVPAAIYSRLNRLAHGAPKRLVNGVEVVALRPRGRSHSGLGQLAAAAGIAAVLLIAVSAFGLIVPRHSATWTANPDVGPGQWTGLEWHDITATKGWGFWPDPGSRGIVAWRGGFAVVGDDNYLWTSKDGLTWAHAPSLPRYVTAVNLNGDLLVGAPGSAGPGGKNDFWLSSDGLDWQQVAVPFDTLAASSMAAVPGRVVVVSTSNLNSMPSGPSSLYVTADAKTWRKATLPADLAGASAVNVFAFGGRFLADGLILDPNGNRTYVDQNNVSTTWSEHAWISDDGLVWTPYSPVMPAGVGSDWFGMQAGRRGMGNGWIYTTDGATWLVDTAMLPSLHQDTEMASDGTRIIMATDWGAGFYVGEGDGRWQKLAQGGNVGSLPGGGQLLLLPDGVLWSVGGHVYFGQALSGVAPQGSLAPSKTVVPVNTPGPVTPGPVASPADTPTPAPSVDEGFTTPGTLSGWKGFSWGELPPDSPIVKAGAGPAVGPLGQQVLHWRGGYVASILGLWASPDGRTWMPLTVPGTQESPVFSVGPAGLVAFGGTPQGTGAPGSVWTSGDGLTWTRAGVPNLAGRLISVAGTVSGLVATVAVSSGSGDSVTNTYVVEHSTDGVNWEIEAVAPGVVLSESPNVQSNGGRFFLIGSTANALSGGDKPPFVLLSTWPTSSYVWWSDDGKTWTRSGGNFAGFAGTIQFGRDGMRLDMTLGTVPGGSGTAVSTDGGNTWIPDDKFGPLGVAPCQGECSVAADGVIGSNGTYFVAVKNGGKKAWLSYDGRTWTPIAWAGGDPSVAGYGQFAVLPRGVIEGGSYGAAQ